MSPEINCAPFECRTSPADRAESRRVGVIELSCLSLTFQGEAGSGVVLAWRRAHHPRHRSWQSSHHPATHANNKNGLRPAALSQSPNVKNGNKKYRNVFKKKKNASKDAARAVKSQSQAEKLDQPSFHPGEDASGCSPLVR